ncbi:MAG: hypothetical protein DRJ32_02005 [Thermoprotei archaeon]|nr:MAG: hypothetical protein DRJ32_02005 [Thermoprotei archaeon]
MKPKESAKYIIIAIILREIVCFWTGHPWDFEIWVRVGKLTSMGNNPYTWLFYDEEVSFAPYPVMTSIGYLPFIALLSAGIYLLYSVSGFSCKYFYYFLLKQPFILGDILSALALAKYSEIRGLNEEKCLDVLRLWLFNPLVIYFSSIWGMFDSIIIFLVFVALIYLEHGEYFKASLALGVAVFVKIIALIYVPLILLFRRRKIATGIAYILLAVSIPVVLTAIPFIVLGWPTHGITECMTYQSGPPAYGGMSFFSIIEYISLILTLDPNLSLLLSKFWIIMLGITYLLTLVEAISIESRRIRIRYRRIDVLDAKILVASAFIPFRPFSAEQWSLYLFAPLTIKFAKEDERNHSRFFLVIAILVFLYTLTNNTLFIRYLSPLSAKAFYMDLTLNNTPPTAALRYCIKMILALFTSISILELYLYTIRGAPTEPDLYFVVRRMRSSGKTVIAKYVLYFISFLIIVTLLDYTVILMVTDWSRALEWRIFLGDNLIGLYHVLLGALIVFYILTIGAFMKCRFMDRAATLTKLILLSILATAIAQPLFQVLKGEIPLKGRPLYLAFGVTVDERIFFIYTVTFSVLALAYVDRLVNLLARYVEKR